MLLRFLALLAFGFLITSNAAADSNDTQLRVVSFDDVRSNGGKIEALLRVEPQYPLNEAARCRSGHTKLKFDIGPDGHPTNIEILESKPSRSFGRKGVEALRQWRYTPPRIDGEPVIIGGEEVELNFDVLC